MDSIDLYIYSRGLFNNFGDRFQVNNDPSTGTIDLIIPSVEERDAGAYVCEDEGGHGVNSTKRAQLIVLGEPVCKSNMSSYGVIGPNDCDIEPEYFQLSCSVIYLGNIPPNMEWKKVGDNATNTTGVSTEKSSDVVTYKLTMKGDLDLNGSTYVCQTTRSVTSQYNCTTSDQVKILYSIKINATADVIMIGDTILCSVFSSQSCKYEWNSMIKDDATVLYLTNTLKPRSTGLHICKATCPMRGELCIINEAMLVNVTEKTIPFSYTETTGTSISTITIAVLVPFGVASVLLGLLRYFIVKKRKRKFDRNVVEESYNFELSRQPETSRDNQRNDERGDHHRPVIMAEASSSSDYLSDSSALATSVNSDDPIIKVLQLERYYPQKLRPADALMIRGTSEVDDCQYGMMIIRKLLEMDHSAIYTVTEKINKVRKELKRKETECEKNKSSEGMKEEELSVGKHKKYGRAISEELAVNLHPMDLMIAVFNCCDNFLRQMC